MQRRFSLKFLTLPLILLLIVLYFTTGADGYLTLSSLQQNRDFFAAQFSAQPILLSFTFGLIYVVVTAASIPGAAILTLAAGAIFGLYYGILIASVASSLGAAFAFLGARYLFRNIVERKFRQRLEVLNLGLQKEGALYLLTLRLVPVFPFFLVNLLMGITNFSVWKFFFISQVGMLPGTLLYVYAGTEIMKIHSVHEILSPSLLLSFTLLGFVPLLFKWFVKYHCQKVKPTSNPRG